MKTFYSVLFCTLLSMLSFSQKTKVKDSITKKPIQLDEVIIVGNKKTDPTHIKVFNVAKSKFLQPKNMADLFNNINGFSSIKRGSYAIDPSFRAAQYEQLNILYDGGTKVMHACPNRMDPITTHIIPEEIAKIEVVKGPYTVRYGATFGAIINLVTKKPTYEDYGLHGKVSAGYESNGNSLVNSYRLQYIKEKFDLVTNAGYRNFGNYTDGIGTEIPSSFKSTDYGIKFGYNFSEKERFQVHWRQSFGKDVLHAALPMDTEYDNSSIISLDYKISNFTKKSENFIAKAYYSYVDHLMTNTNRPSFMMMEAVSTVEATTFGGKLEYNWKPTEKVQFFSGLDLLHIARDGGRTRLVKVMNGNTLPMPMTFNDKVWQDSYITDIGFFTEAKWAKNPKTIFTFGVRYDLITSNIKDPENDFALLYDLKKRTEHTISGTVSVKKLIATNFILEAAFGRGTRSANMIERYINHFTVGQDPFEYIGNPNLKAEVNNQFEIGFKGFRKRNKTLQKFSYATSVYYSIFENYIVAVVDDTKTRKFNPMKNPVHPKVFRNIDESYKTGFEAMIKLDFINDFYFKTELAYVYARNKDFNESLPLIPPFTSKFSIGYQKDKFWANAQYNVISKQSEIATSFRETATNGYNTLDIRSGFKPFKNTVLGFAVLNVFDKNYHNHLNFSFINQANFGRIPINEPGRNISVFLQFSF